MPECVKLEWRKLNVFPLGFLSENSSPFSNGLQVLFLQG